MTDKKIFYTEVLCDFCGGYLRKVESEITASNQIGIFFNLTEEHTVSGKTLPAIKKQACWRCVLKALERGLQN